MSKIPIKICQEQFNAALSGTEINTYLLRG